ncbi:molybdopterin-synthase adenylyltransferase MoeB [Rhodospirillaceae bacterium KN72]|uniref:Molybdopterin-synthase adenylyltransferase n=1 Tax=Pacificispira spongiicola TaxID=2729598 RepID=A0A7Y0E0J4_9PROT|nr:molybdopterin-synthase adenylyltransferase MoeB [Pacificispira spongiicola]NMM44981.1 molybdopterin-synthase adenylyltransferase MoeB [Pacificispira spongiicola]
MQDELDDAQLERYARHVILDEVGEEGQLKLLSARVLVVGAGGLGAPILMYLAAAGVGTLGIVDHDTVDLSNLQRQVIHSTDDIGVPKVRSAAERIELINPDIEVIEHRTRLGPDNAESLFADYDLIVDGSDNFSARYLSNETCVKLKKPLVSAAVVRFEGQLSTFKPHVDGPCYRCLFPEPPDADIVPRCDTVGIFGAITGVMGSLQATEVLKEILGLGTSMAGHLLLFDALDQTFRKIKTAKDPDCPICGG